MRTEVLKAGTIDAAVKKILDELKDDAAGGARSRGRNNVIYFDGWDGLGASAVLRAVGQHLTRAVGQHLTPAAPAAGALEFSQIFHIDCSKWESRRVMQRMIAQQLNLPDLVMEMFDAQDDEDDYKGVGKGSRAEIPRVAEVINQQMQKLNRFLLIFHNGSNNEIDLDSLGFPFLDRYSRSKVLWTFQGRFRLYPRTKVDRALNSTRTTDVVLSAEISSGFSNPVKMEAADVARNIIVRGGIINLDEGAANWFLYMMKLCRLNNDLINYDLGTHGCNYWTCDSIIHLQQGDGTDDGVDRLWLSSEALKCEMQLDADYYKSPSDLPSPAVRRLPESMPYWTSPTFGIMLIPDPDGWIPKGMFQQFDKLCVLKLSACTFSYIAPPFLYCHNIRFLWLDHCNDSFEEEDDIIEFLKEFEDTTNQKKEENTTHQENEVEETTDQENEVEVMDRVYKEVIHQFWQRLWVLDVRYSAFFNEIDITDFRWSLRGLNVMGENISGDMKLSQKQMPNIHKIQVTKSVVNSITLSGVDKMVILELSENTSVWALYVESCSSLETIIINGDTTNLRVISLTRCAKLKNLFLSGLFSNLYNIYITEAAVETLDLSAVMAPNLRNLLLKCGKLCAILWAPADGMRTTYLDKLHIDTTGAVVVGYKPAERNFDWYISVKDARILGWLEPVAGYFGGNPTHVEISSPHHPYVDDVASKNDGMKIHSGQLIKDIETYADIIATLKDTNKQQMCANEGDSDAPAVMSICPPPPHMASKQGCYIDIKDQTRAKLHTASTTIPAFICNGAKILHVHDSSSITGIHSAPLDSTTWNQLEWCRVERCLKLGCVFNSQLGVHEGSNGDMFKNLRTVWASHLPKACRIWVWNGSSGLWLYGEKFENLTFLHLDYCPRLIHIIHHPAIFWKKALDKLESIEILWCGDLSVAFHFYNTPRKFTSEIKVWRFLKLKHIWLHELPKLKNISNIGIRIETPELETIKIRGCWSLRTLPIVDSKNVVECDCEKEWWDRLEWESVDHASKYKLTHPRHYKKTMLKGSVLR